MRALKLTLFIIALVVFTTQTFRHIYVKYLYPRTSVLDNYKEEIEIKVDKTKSLDELEKLYKETNDKMKKIEKDDDNFKKNKEYKKLSDELDIIKNRIKKGEDINNRRNELVFYWLFGLICIMLGVVFYIIFNKWIGTAFVITGISEMIVWTSPLYRIRSYGFDDLLNLKLLLSIISWFILIILWVINEKIFDKK
ncbi:MAG: hypothetical protein JXB50_15330 [Spirochaetes bacterium]|nr:hypothetical protein [Spirochaetota bacterium]